MPAGTPVQPLDGLLVQRFRPERGGQRRDLIRSQPVQRYLQPVLDARQHVLSRLVQEVAGAAVDHDGQDRIDRQPPQHEGQGLRRLPVDPLQIIDHDRRQVIRRHDAIAVSTCAGFSRVDTKMVLWSRGKGAGASRSSRWCWRWWSW
jgi:hypothetical protein